MVHPCLVKVWVFRGTTSSRLLANDGARHPSYSMCQPAVENCHSLVRHQPHFQEHTPVTDGRAMNVTEPQIRKAVMCVGLVEKWQGRKE